jgi:hypothetical protein
MSKNQKKNKAVASWTQLSIGNSMSASQRIVRRLSQAVGVQTTSATGTLFVRIQSSACANAIEWSNLAAIYVQYRVIEIIVTLIPLQPFALSAGVNTAALGQGVVIAGTDRSGVLAVLSSYATVWGLTNPKAFTTQTIKPIRYRAKAIDLEDQNFTAVGAPQSLFSVQYALNFNPVSTTLPALYQLNEFVVEFKGAQA